MRFARKPTAAILAAALLTACGGTKDKSTARRGGLEARRQNVCHHDDRQELHQPRVPFRADRCRGCSRRDVEAARHQCEDRLAHSSERRRHRAGPAHCREAVNDGVQALLISASDAGKVTGAIDDAVARARRAGHDVRQRRAALQALLVLRRRRHRDGSSSHGRARQADGRQREDRHPRRQPERRTFRIA